MQVIINDKEYEVEKDDFILKICTDIGIEIPTLCNDDRLAPSGSCRLCQVEIEGVEKLLTACTTKVKEGMVINTHSEKVIKARRDILDMLVSNHPLDCLTCEKAGDCKLQDYCYEYEIIEGSYRWEMRQPYFDDTNLFYTYDARKCILCGLCIRVCDELQGTSAIGFKDRGFETVVSTPFDEGLGKSTCVSCGNCVSVCPVGALEPKSKQKFRYWEIKTVRTTCAYCGVGCQMDLKVKGNQIVEIQPAFDAHNEGLLCVKGKFSYNFISHPDRLTKPLIRKNGDLVESSWDEAFDLITSKMKQTKREFGSDAFAGLTSARCTNEENYMFQKMFRSVLGTNNIDHCARLCHASTVAGLAITLGSGAMTNSIQEIKNTDVIFIIGSNTSENHPIIGAIMKQAKKAGAKMIVADPRRIEMAEYADVFLQLKPGTNIALLNGMMHVIIEKGLEDEEYIEKKTENYEELKRLVKEYTPERVAEICGIDPEDIIEAATIYGEAVKAGIYYTMGVTQHTTGTHAVMSISNLALLCGNVGVESAGVNPLRGQNNVQGACDMGGLPTDLPGYQKVFKPEVLDKFQESWGSKLSDEVGLTITEMFKAIEEDQVKFLYIMGENPMVSDPDTNHVRKVLESINFLVVQDIFLTETAEMADVVLPAAAFAEKEGTFTNTERRIQRVRKAVEAPGEAKADWEILMELMNRMGYETDYSHPADIMTEIASLTPSYGGVSYMRLENESLQWPVLNKSHPGTKYLHKTAIARGRGLFMPVEHVASAEVTSDEYPYILTTGRILYHYHTMTMTGREEGLMQLAPNSYVELNEITANKLGIKNGDKVKLTSRRGQLETTARVTDIIDEGVVFMPFHYMEGKANILTNTAIDQIAKIPELKVAAVRVEKAKM